MFGTSMKETNVPQSEFDAPSNLLQECSLFKALVDGSSDKDALYDAVKKKHIASSSTTFVRQ